MPDQHVALGVIAAIGQGRRETGRREQANRLEFPPPFPVDIQPLAPGLSRRDLATTFLYVLNENRPARMTGKVSEKIVNA